MNKWYFLNFKIKWDKKSPVNFFVDLIIIDLLINPAVGTFKQKLILWRIHRSATEDGHILRFIFYTTSETSKNVLKNIKDNKFYRFIKENYLEDMIKEEGSQDIEGAGDGDWPKEINRVWPYYIMGCSEMYMKLIEEINKSMAEGIDKNNREQLEQYYKEIEKEIDAKWFTYGSHSFLHHLGAIFGYKFIFLRPRFIDENSRGIIL